MNYPESDYVNTITLARQYDTSVKGIRTMLEDLMESGYEIKTLAWGKSGKLKINQHEFRAALFHEYGKKKGWRP